MSCSSFALIRVGARVLMMAHKAHTEPVPIPTMSVTTSLFSLHSHCPSHSGHFASLQGLFTCCSLCLECHPFLLAHIPMWLSPSSSSGLCSNVSFSVSLSLTSYLKQQAHTLHSQSLPNFLAVVV